jgi:hypothetical protein
MSGLLDDRDLPVTSRANVFVPLIVTKFELRDLVPLVRLMETVLVRNRDGICHLALYLFLQPAQK